MVRLQGLCKVEGLWTSEVNQKISILSTDNIKHEYRECLVTQATNGSEQIYFVLTCYAKRGLRLEYGIAQQKWIAVTLFSALRITYAYNEWWEPCHCGL